MSASEEDIRRLTVILQQCLRHGRWGTCVMCPETDGVKQPHLCVETERYDHQLGVPELVQQIVDAAGYRESGRIETIVEMALGIAEKRKAE